MIYVICDKYLLDLVHLIDLFLILTCQKFKLQCHGWMRKHQSTLV